MVRAPAYVHAAAVDLAARLGRCTDGREVGGTEIRPNLPAGFASGPGDAASGAALLDHARAAAPQADDSAPVALHGEDARRAARARFELAHDLRRALREDEFRLHFQPVVGVENGAAHPRAPKRRSGGSGPAQASFRRGCSFQRRKPRG